MLSSATIFLSALLALMQGGSTTPIYETLWIDRGFALSRQNNIGENGEFQVNQLTAGFQVGSALKAINATHFMAVYSVPLSGQYRVFSRRFDRLGVLQENAKRISPNHDLEQEYGTVIQLSTDRLVYAYESNAGANGTDIVYQLFTLGLNSLGPERTANNRRRDNQKFPDIVEIQDPTDPSQNYFIIAYQTEYNNEPGRLQDIAFTLFNSTTGTQIGPEYIVQDPALNQTDQRQRVPSIVVFPNNTRFQICFQQGTGNFEILCQQYNAASIEKIGGPEAVARLGETSPLRHRFACSDLVCLHAYQQGPSGSLRRIIGQQQARNGSFIGIGFEVSGNSDIYIGPAHVTVHAPHIFSVVYNAAIDSDFSGV